MTILCQPGDVFHLSLTKNKFIMARKKQDGHASEAAKTWRISFTSDELSELELALNTRIRELKVRAETFGKKPENFGYKDSALEWSKICESLIEKINEAWAGFPG